jgi:hypothetical protein
MGNDISQLIKDGGIRGISYNIKSKTYTMSEDVVLSANEYITMNNGETFEGKNHSISYGADGLGNSVGVFVVNLGAGVHHPVLRAKIKNIIINSNVVVGDDGVGGGGVLIAKSNNVDVKNVRHEGPLDNNTGGLAGQDAYNYTFDSCSQNGNVAGENASGFIAPDSANIVPNVGTRKVTKSRFNGTLSGTNSAGFISIVKKPIKFSKNNMKLILASSTARSNWVTVASGVNVTTTKNTLTFSANFTA